MRFAFMAEASSASRAERASLYLQMFGAEESADRGPGVIPNGQEQKDVGRYERRRVCCAAS